MERYLTDREAIAYLKGELDEVEREAFEEALTHSAELRGALERTREVFDLIEAAKEERIIKIVHSTIQSAIEAGASDIHVVPARQADEDGTIAVIVYFRIDGRLHEVERYPSELRHAIVDRWKMMSECSLRERKLPQEGVISIEYHGKNYNVRVTVLPTVIGARVTARLLPGSSLQAELGSLGVSDSRLAAMRRLIRRPSGLVAVAAPARSGRTTLLYSMLLDIRSEGSAANIMTVEDPVEYSLDILRREDVISQTSVDYSAGLTFARALRGVLRSDPDVVLVGDLPDRETAELALRMAMTGHRVLASLTANSALGGIRRLAEMGIDPSMIAHALAGLVSLRLVRQSCAECLVEDAPDPAALQRLGLSLADGPFRRGAGCAACRQTGYSGRTALSEVLELNDAVRQCIVGNAPAEMLWQEIFGRTGGSLWDDAREKVRWQLTTVEEVIRPLFDYPCPATRSGTA
jgi:type II secretory ATPase GspE/PulE/Tfp pilus assembly ATPase PilB-like protein